MLRKFAILAVSGVLSLGATTLQAQPAGACTVIAACGGVAGSLIGPGWDQGDNGYISWNATFSGMIHGDPAASVAYINGQMSGGTGYLSLFAYNFSGSSYYSNAQATRTAVGPVTFLQLSINGTAIGLLTQVAGVPEAGGFLLDATG